MFDTRGRICDAVGLLCRKLHLCVVCVLAHRVYELAAFLNEKSTGLEGDKVINYNCRVSNFYAFVRSIFDL